jgi:hypothetical protein
MLKRAQFRLLANPEPCASVEQPGSTPGRERGTDGLDPDNLALLAFSSPRSFLGVASSRQTPHKHKSEGGDALVLDFRRQARGRWALQGPAFADAALLGDRGTESALTFEA